MSEVDIRRQTVLVAKRDVTYDELVSGTAFNAIHLPAGSRVTGGFVDVTTALDPETSAVIDIGDTVGDTPDADRYSTSQINVAAAALTALSAPITGAVIPNGGAWITITPTIVDAAGDLSAGVIRLQVEYVQDDRQTEFHAYRG